MRVCSSAMSKWNECCGLHRSSISYRKIRWTYPWSFVLYSTYNGHVLKIYLQSYNSYWICEWSKLNHSFFCTTKRCCVNSSNSPDKMFRESGLHWKVRPISFKFNLFFIEYQEEKCIKLFLNEWHGSLYNLQSFPIFHKGALSIANLEEWNHWTSHEHLNLSAFCYKFLSRKDWFVVKISFTCGHKSSWNGSQSQIYLSQ